MKRHNTHLVFSISLMVFLSPLFFVGAQTASSDSFVSVRSHSSGSTITSTNDAYGDQSYASTSVVIVVNGETVVDIQRTSDGSPIRVEAVYPQVKVRSDASFDSSNAHIIKETVPTRTVARQDEVVRVPEYISPLLAPLDDVDQLVEKKITQLTDEVKDRLNNTSDGVDKVDMLFVTPPWTHMILSFARTMSYVTSLLFL